MKLQRRFLLGRNKRKAFSLVEVVLALGIVVFAGFALIGLLGVGLQTSHDSKEQLQAATIAEFLCSTRRAAPTNDLSPLQPNFPLPALNTAANNLKTPTFLTWDGLANTSSSRPARFGLLYQITPMVPTVPAGNTTGTSTVYLCLYWPPSATPGANSSHFELTTTFALP